MEFLAPEWREIVDMDAVNRLIFPFGRHFANNLPPFGFKNSISGPTGANMFIIPNQGLKL